MAPYNYMDDFGGAYEDYSGGYGDTSWMSPSYQSPKKNPWEYDYAPSSGGLDYMQMPEFNSEPYQFNPEPFQPSPLSLSQAPSPDQSLGPNTFAADYMKPKYDPMANLFPAPGDAPKQVNDPMARQVSFPSGVDFMAEQPAEPTLPFQERQERDFPLLDRFAELAWNKPTREGNRGGKLNKLAAIMAGGMVGLTKGAGAGIAAGQQISDQPYMRAMEDWKEQLAAGKDAATLERYQAENLRKAKYGEELMQFKNDKQRQDHAIATQRARAVGLEVLNDPTTGLTYAVDKVTGKQTLLGKFALSTAEQAELAGKKAGAESAATLGDKRTIAADAAAAAQKGREYTSGQDWAKMLSGQQFQERQQKAGFANQAKIQEYQLNYDMLKMKFADTLRIDDPNTFSDISEALAKAALADPERGGKYMNKDGINWAAVNATDADRRDFAKLVDSAVANMKRGGFVRP